MSSCSLSSLSAPSTCCGVDDARDAQLDFGELVDGDEWRCDGRPLAPAGRQQTRSLSVAGEGGEGRVRGCSGHDVLLVLGMPLRRMGLPRRLQAFLVGFDQRVDLLGVDARHQVLVLVDRCSRGYCAQHAAQSSVPRGS